MSRQNADIFLIYAIDNVEKVKVTHNCVCVCVCMTGAGAIDENES